MARVYLSGAMRGLPESNYPEFNAVADQLRAAGHDVLNPAESFLGVPFPGRAACLKHDLAIIALIDCVAVLDNWEDAPGARLEVSAAWGFDLPVYTAKSMVRGTPALITRTSVSIPRESQYYRGLPLVGLSGFAGAGKDEVAQILVKHGWARVAFADPLKEVATAMGWDGQKDETGRVFLQNLGVGVRDHLDPDTWVLKGEEQIEYANGPCVVTDARFPNEMFMIRRRGGILVRVDRPGLQAVNGHISEHAVSAADCDYVFHNDGTLEELPHKVEKFFRGIGFGDHLAPNQQTLVTV